MTILKTHMTIWLALAALALDLIAFLLLGYETVFKAIQVPILGIAVTAATAWTPTGLAAIRRGGTSAADKIALAIWMSWTVLALHRAYTFFVAMWDRPDWLVYSPISSMIGTLIIVAGIYSAFATVSDPAVVRPDKTWTLISTAVGAFAAGALATYALLYGIKL